MDAAAAYQALLSSLSKRRRQERQTRGRHKAAANGGADIDSVVPVVSSEKDAGQDQRGDAPACQLTGTEDDDRASPTLRGQEPAWPDGDNQPSALLQPYEAHFGR